MKVTTKLTEALTEAATQFKVGDKVKLTSKFMKSTGMYTHAPGADRGVVPEIVPFGSGILLGVKWGDGHVGRVLDKNVMLTSKPDYPS